MKRQKQTALSTTREIRARAKDFHDNGRVAMINLHWQSPARSSYAVRDWVEGVSLGKDICEQIRKKNKLICWEISASTSVPRKYNIGKKRTDKLFPACEEELQRVIDYFSKKYKKRIPMPWVNLKKKGKTAGTCYIHGEIRLNWQVLKNNRMDFILRTPGHEAVHWVQYFLYGKANHSNQFKDMMKEVGLPTERCHRYDLSGNGYHAYRCKCRTHYVTEKKHIKIQNQIRIGYKGYSCGSCKETLTYKGMP